MVLFFPAVGQIQLILAPLNTETYHTITLEEQQAAHRVFRDRNREQKRERCWTESPVSSTEMFTCPAAARQRAGLHVCSRTAGKMKQAGRWKRERRVKRRRSCWFTHRSLGWQSEVQPQPPQDTNFLCSPRIMIAVSGVRLYRYRGGSIGFITSTHSQL